MKTLPRMAAAALIAGSGFVLALADAPQPAIKLTDLQRHDLSAPGREPVQVRVEIGFLGLQRGIDNRRL